MPTEALKKAIQKYQKSKTRICMWCDPGEKEQIEAGARQEGKSTTQFIMDIIKEKLNTRH